MMPDTALESMSGGKAARKLAPRRAAKLAPELAPKLALCIALLLVAGYVHHRWWQFLCDDAFIALRYAHNLWRYGEALYNPWALSPPAAAGVEGYTSPLWVFLLAGLGGMGAPLGEAALCLCALGALAALGASAGLAADPGFALGLGRIKADLALARGSWSGPGEILDKEEPAADRAAVLAMIWCIALLVATPEFVVWASGGLESSCATALGLWACFFYRRARMGPFHAAAALASLARLDTLLWIAGFVLAGSRGTLWARLRDGWGRPACLWWLLPLFHLLWRRYYYGAWLPHTWEVKRHGAALALDWGLGYLWAWGSASFLGLVLLLALPWTWRQRDAWGLILVNCGYAVAVGGDFMAYSRFLLPATCMTAALGGQAAAQIILGVGGPSSSPSSSPRARSEADRSREPRPQTRDPRGEGRSSPSPPSPSSPSSWPALARRGRALGVALLVWSIPLGLALRISSRVEADRERGWLQPPGGKGLRSWLSGGAQSLGFGARTDIGAASWGFESVAAMEQFAAIRLAAGRVFAQSWPPTTVASVGAAGAFPFAADFVVYDLYGLVDPTVRDFGRAVTPRRARPGHTWVGGKAWIEHRKPELRCEIGWAGLFAPSSRDLRQRVGRGKGYGWECVETGPVRLRTREKEGLASHFYCCLRAAKNSS